MKAVSTISEAKRTEIWIPRRDWRRAESMPDLILGSLDCFVEMTSVIWGLNVWVTQILPSNSEEGNPRKGLRWSSKRKTLFLGLMANYISLKAELWGFFQFLPKESRSSEISPFFTLALVNLGKGWGLRNSNFFFILSHEPSSYAKFSLIWQMRNHLYEPGISYMPNK